MSDPFMRVDVSQTSRDFQPVALEPGLPLLDRTNTNCQTLRKWLGGYVAEAERHGDRVAFFVRDEESRRLDSAFCIPVTDKDLSGELAKDFRELRRRLEAAKPLSSNEQLIHRVALEQLRGLTEESQSWDRRCCLFKFRDPQGKLHLVWSPGYRRRDNEPAAPLICTNSTCSSLFLQRRETGAKCPVCQAVRKVAETTSHRSGFGRSLLRGLAALLLIGLGIGGGFWWQKPQLKLPAKSANTAPLRVEPAEWSGPVGSQVQFVITRSDGKVPETVTNSAASTVANPKILSVKPYESLGKALSPGQTEVTFFVGPLTAQASVTVKPRDMPSKLRLEPEKLEIGVGTTARIRLFGEYADGPAADLTDSAEWEAPHDEKFSVYNGRVEGVEPGAGTLRVRYRTDDQVKPLEAAAEVTVLDPQYKTLTLALEPSIPKVLQPARVRATVTTTAGQELSVGDSKDLSIAVTPAERAQLAGTVLTGQTEGAIKLSAKFRGLSAELAATVEKGSPPSALEVSPQTLELTVGEIAELNIVSPQPQTLRVKSSRAEAAEVTLDHRIVGRSIGSAEIEVTDGSGSQKIPVTVSARQWKSLAIEPPRIALRTDEPATIRVFGVMDDKTRIELAADHLTWPILPPVEYVDFDKAKLQLKGVQPTGSEPERLTVRSQGLEASADVQVSRPPLVLVLLPEGSLEVPIGQKRTVSVQAKTGGAAAVDVPADRIEWQLNPPQGSFEITNGEIHAKTENASAVLSAKYQGVTSNEVRLSSVSSPPLTLHLSVDPTAIQVGETGVVRVDATGPGGPVAIDEDGLRFESTAPEILKIDPRTGAFRALSAGTEGSARVRASHPAAKEPAEISIRVAPVVAATAAKPASLRLTSSQGQPLQLAIAAESSDWKAEAVAANGRVTDVTRQVTLQVEGDPEEPVVAVQNGRIIGLSSGDATLQAAFGDVRTTEGLRVHVTAEPEIDELRVIPADITLVVRDTATLQADGYKGGKRIGNIANRNDLIWKAKDPSTVEINGSELIANRVGATTVTVQLGSVESKPSRVTVLEKSAAAGKLTVQPGQVRMKVGEHLSVGSDVLVQRGDVDFSSQSDVAPAGKIVVYHPDSRTLEAVSVGRTRVAFAHRDQTATLNVEVVSSDPPSPDAKVVIEPATGRIAVAELFPVKVFVVLPNGERTETSAALTSSDIKLAITRESAVQGMANGEVTIEARVPGVAELGRAKYRIVDLHVDRLVFKPSLLHLSVGQRKSFALAAITPQGRKELGEHSDLQVEVEGGRKDVIELSGREILGVEGGKASVVATWKGKHQRSLPVSVKSDPIQELVIQPDDKTIEEGQAVDYQVFAKRAESLQPLQPIDGLQLQIDNPVIATGNKSDLRVTGLQKGKTNVTAKFGSRRAAAQLTVTAPAQPPAPPPPPVGLRFIPDLFRLEMGTPGDSIRVVQVNADGTEEEVDHLVNLDVHNPKDVIAIEQSASGPVVRPKKIGQTQIDATLGALKTAKPLLIDVAEELPEPARLRVFPPKLQLEVGQTERFARAEVVPPSGRSAVRVPFKVTATPNQSFEVSSDGSIRALSPGQAVCNVIADDPSGKYEGVATTAMVEVSDPNASGSQQTDRRRRLVLSGPSETTIGAEVALHAESVLGTNATDVTAQAQLVLVAGNEDLAEVRPGGRIVAKRPGKLSVQARLNDLTSKPHEIIVRPVDTEFARLELEIARGRMGAHERRNYKLWGYPLDGGARQDLTSAVTSDASNKDRPSLRLQMLKPNPGTQVVAHDPTGALVGRQPGFFSVQAELGDKLSTEPITLEVVGDDNPDRLRVEPEQIQVPEGKDLPPLKVLVSSAGDRQFRELDLAHPELQFDVSDPGVLQAKSPGRFAALRPGPARIDVTYGGAGGLKQTVPVTVRFDPFAKVELGPRPMFSGNTLTVDLAVSANTTDANLEYRCVLPGEEKLGGTERPWVKSERDGDRLVANVKSPRIPLEKGKDHFTIVIECKDQTSKQIDRYPFAFELKANRNAGSNAPDK